MKKRAVALLLTFALIFAFVGCNQSDSQQVSDDVEVIIEEVIMEGDTTVSNESVVSSNTSQETESAPISSEQTTVSSQVSSVVSQEKQEGINIDYEWKSHSEDYKLIAFTFDDGPGDLMDKYVQYFAAFDGAGTFFINGRNIKSSSDYNKLQNAVNYGWDIGNHGENHLVATIGGANGTEATYDELKADITTLTHKLETNLKSRNGSAYSVNLYRPPNIKPTANTFKICGEENLAVIWLKYDALDWDTTKTYQDRYNVFKDGIKNWKDGDIILCHEVQQYAGETYQILEELLPDFYRAGYRFCSINEIMQLRGISIDQISGELNEVAGNRSMVTNVLDAAKQGKK